MQMGKKEEEKIKAPDLKWAKKSNAVKESYPEKRMEIVIIHKKKESKNNRIESISKWNDKMSPTKFGSQPSLYFIMVYFNR